MDYIFGGISMPFIGEGYVNFGLMGSLLFMLFLGILLGNLDRIYLEFKEIKQRLFIPLLFFFVWPCV